MKNTLKNNHNHTLNNHTLKQASWDLVKWFEHVINYMVYKFGIIKMPPMRFQNIFLKIIFFVFLNYINILILKINLK
jgi:hypothetical protein